MYRCILVKVISPYRCGMTTWKYVGLPTLLLNLITYTQGTRGVYTHVLPDL